MIFRGVYYELIKRELNKRLIYEIVKIKLFIMNQ